MRVEDQRNLIRLQVKREHTPFRSRTSRRSGPGRRGMADGWGEGSVRHVLWEMINERKKERRRKLKERKTAKITTGECRIQNTE